MEFSANSNIELNAGVVFRSNKDGTIVVMKMNDDDMFYKINGVAAEIWQNFSDKTVNLGVIAESIAKDYSVSPEKIILDSQEFLSKAIKMDLIRVV